MGDSSQLVAGRDNRVNVHLADADGFTDKVSAGHDHLDSLSRRTCSVCGGWEKIAHAVPLHFSQCSGRSISNSSVNASRPPTGVKPKLSNKCIARGFAP